MIKFFILRALLTAVDFLSKFIREDQVILASGKYRNIMLIPKTEERPGLRLVEDDNESEGPT